MKNLLKIFFVISIQFLFSQSFKTQHYTMQNGLPSQIAYSGLQDKEGYIWVTFDNGVAKYTGKKWIVYDSKSYFEKPDVVSEKNEIRRVSDFLRIRMDKSGKLWVVSRFHGDVFYFAKEKWHWQFKLSDGEIADNWDFDFVSDSLMVFYQPRKIEFRNTKGVIIPSRGFTKVPNSGKQLIKSVAVYQGEAYYLINNSIVKITPDGKEDVKNISPETKCISYTNGKLFYFGSNKVGYFDKNFKEVVLQKVDFLYAESDKNSFVFDNESFLFWGNTKKLKFYDKRLKIQDNFSLLNGHLTEGASDIFQDNEKNIWIISFRGVTKIINNSLVSMNIIDGLLDNEVSAIEQFKDGRLLFGHTNGISICDFKKVKDERISKINFDKFNLRDDSRIQDMQRTPEGNIYLALTWNKIGVLNQNLNLKIVQRNDDRNYLSISPYINDQFLVSSNTAIFRMTRYFQFTKIFEGRSRSLKLLKDNRIISFNQYGADIISGNKIENLKTRNPQKNDSFCAYEFENKILIGTRAGLFELVNDKLEDNKGSLPKINKPTYFIEKGYKNDLWFGLQGGALKYNTVTGDSMFFTPENGLAGYETNRNAGFLDKDGNFWIGTDRGVSCFPRTDEGVALTKPRAKITEFKLVDDKYNTISIKFDGLSFIDEQKLRYRLQLYKDNQLFESSTLSLTEKEFAGLQQGDYAAKLVVIRSDGVESDPIFSARLTIIPQIYQTVWFYLMIIISIGSFIYFSLKNISKYKLNKAEKAQQQKTILLLRATEAERNRIAQDMHDSIAQSLVAAKYSIEALKDNPSEKNIDASASLIIRAWKELKSIIYNLRPMIIESEGLNQAVESVCEQINILGGVKVKFFGKASQFDISIDEKTIVYRIIQEGLNNILKHSRCRNAFIRFVKNGDEEVILIGDDGKGLKDTNKIEGHGLFNIRQRCDAIGANLEIQNRKKRGMKLKITLKNKGKQATKFSLERK